MKRAKSAGIDAFALNIGTDDYTDAQLGYAYDSANNNGMKVFISFDFHFWSVGDAAAVGQKVKKYADHPGQLRIDNRVFEMASMQMLSEVLLALISSSSPILLPGEAPQTVSMAL
ncbi:hypothetical protein LB505_012373 [Fusarium chuoi]|nr:hypothetical protein LB505_012373 [Fusarium chuoi]